MTRLLDIGLVVNRVRDFQLNVLIETIIITATNAAIGITFSQSLIKTTKINKKTPALKVDSRPRPPDFTLIIDCPIIAQPAMPPINPLQILAMPCPLHSRNLSLGVSV